MVEINLRNYAYLGDAVWELYIRKQTITLTNNSQKLHKITIENVKTHTQSELLHFIEKDLTEEELELARRARNLPIPIGRRNIQTEYRQATAFEALIGWWYEFDKTRLKEMIGKLQTQLQLQQ